jgi:hypothetical protein
MLNKFREFWKIHGQSTGFIILIVILNVYWIGLHDEMKTNEWVTLGWLVLFFGGATFLGLQGRKYGWKLPKDIKDTH